MLKPLIVIILSFLAMGNAFSQELVKDAKIIKIGSTNWDKKVFYLQVEGGTGPCANTPINFPEVYAQSTIAYAQMHAMAMTAFIHGKRISIYNYDDKKFANDSICTGANAITIYD